jgi:Ni/Fe-hydrogenase subunit HybB-like protein
MVLYAFQVSAFFSLLWRRGPRARWRLFLQLFVGLVAGALALAWAMYPFPGGPPGP